MSVTAAQLKKAQALIESSKRICVLTGAGISAESGIKTFRDAGGLWETHPVEKVATPEAFSEDPKFVWEFYNARRKAADIAVPNAAHIALARIEIGLKRQAKKKGADLHGNGNGNGNGNGKHTHAPAPFTILTQNIDGLHQQAGSQNVIELHGSIWKVSCTGCEAVSSDFPIEVPLLPHCEECGKLLRPYVVWFGESLDPDILEQADAAVQGCDLFLVIGTSAVIQPAASYPFMAARRGAPVIEINLEATPVTTVAAVSLMGKAGEVLPKLVV